MLQFIDPTFRHSCLVPSLGVMKALEFYDSIPCNNCDNEYIGQTKRQFGTRLKEHQKAVFFCKKENSALSEHTCLLTIQLGGIILKLSPLIGVTTSAFVWKLGI